MTIRQKLMLYLISCEPGIRTEYDLVSFWDRVDFPSKLTENLKPMLEQELIKPCKFYGNNHVGEYEITEKGEEYLDENFNENETFDYINTVHNSEFLMDITKAYINKKSPFNPALRSRQCLH